MSRSKKQSRRNIIFRFILIMITTVQHWTEKLFGIGKAEQDFLLLAVSNGIGSGFVCGGEVFHSHRGFETELGHVSINCKGLQCSCGNRGCLEMYASSYVVREKLKKITG